MCGQWATECGDSEDCGDGEEDGEDGEDEMVGRMLLKNNYKLSDKGAVARWRERTYMQDFTRERGRCSRIVRRWTQPDRHDEVPEADWGQKALS